MDCKATQISNRVINRWNQLDQRAVEATSINAFKGSLSKMTATTGVWGVKGDSGGLHAFVLGYVENQSTQMLCDTGAFANCISLKFYNRFYPFMARHLPS